MTPDQFHLAIERQRTLLALAQETVGRSRQAMHDCRNVRNVGSLMRQMNALRRRREATIEWGRTLFLPFDPAGLAVADAAGRGGAASFRGCESCSSRPAS